MTPNDARDAILRGEHVLATVGTGARDPVLELWTHDGMVISRALSGWCEGTVEPLCAVTSPYLLESLSRKTALQVA